MQGTSTTYYPKSVAFSSLHTAMVFNDPEFQNDLAKIKVLQGKEQVGKAVSVAEKYGIHNIALLLDYEDDNVLEDSNGTESKRYAVVHRQSLKVFRINVDEHITKKEMLEIYSLIESYRKKHKIKATRREIPEHTDLLYRLFKAQIGSNKVDWVSLYSNLEAELPSRFHDEEDLKKYFWRYYKASK